MVLLLLEGSIKKGSVEVRIFTHIKMSIKKLIYFIFKNIPQKFQKFIYKMTFILNNNRISKKPFSFLLESIDDSAIIKTPYGELKIGVSNRMERFRVDTYFTKEPETISWLDETIAPDSVFYDVGANIGIYTLYALHKHRGNVKAICFEPESLNFSRLNRNILLNHFSKQVLAFPLALGKTSKTDKLNLSTFQAGGALHSTRFVKQGEEIHTQGCIIKTLDDFLTDAPHMPLPTHLKIDVDGPELDILQGAINTLKIPNLKHCLIELMADEEKTAQEILYECGFTLAKVCRFKTDPSNYIFMRH